MKLLLLLLANVSTLFFSAHLYVVPTLQALTHRKFTPSIVEAMLREGNKCDLSRKDSIANSITKNFDARVIQEEFVLEEMKLQLGMPEYSVPVYLHHQGVAALTDIFTFDATKKRLYSFSYNASKLKIVDLDEDSPLHHNPLTIFLPSIGELPGYNAPQQMLIDTVTQDLFLVSPSQITVLRKDEHGLFAPIQTLFSQQGDYYSCQASRNAGIKINEQNHTLFVPARQDNNDLDYPYKMYVWKRNEAGLYECKQIITTPHDQKFTYFTLDAHHDEIFIRCLLPLVGDDEPFLACYSMQAKTYVYHNIDGVYTLQSNALPSSISAIALTSNPNHLLGIVKNNNNNRSNIALLERSVDHSYHIHKNLLEEDLDILQQGAGFIVNQASNTLFAQLPQSKLLTLDLTNGICCKEDSCDINSTTTIFDNKIMANVKPSGFDASVCIKIYSSRLSHTYLAGAGSNIDSLQLSHLILLNAILMQATWKEEIIIHHAYQKDFYMIISLLDTALRCRCRFVVPSVRGEELGIHEKDRARFFCTPRNWVSIEQCIDNMLNLNLTKAECIAQVLSPDLDATVRYLLLRNLCLFIDPSEVAIRIKKQKYILFEPQQQDHVSSYALNPHTNTLFKLDNNIVACCTPRTTPWPNAGERIYKEKEEIRNYLIHCDSNHNLLVLFGNSHSAGRLTLLQQQLSGDWNIIQRAPVVQEGFVSASFNNETGDFVVIHRSSVGSLNQISILSYNDQKKEYRYSQSLGVYGSENILCKVAGDTLFIATNDDPQSCKETNKLFVYRKDSTTGCYVLDQVQTLSNPSHPDSDAYDKIVSLSYNKRLDVLGIRRQRSLEVWRSDRAGTYHMNSTYSVPDHSVMRCLVLNQEAEGLFYESRVNDFSTTDWYAYFEHCRWLREASLHGMPWLKEEPLLWDSLASQTIIDEYSLSQLILLANILKQAHAHSGPLLINQMYREGVEAIKEHLEESILSRIQFC